jgi:hypothetical protein
VLRGQVRGAFSQQSLALPSRVRLPSMHVSVWPDGPNPKPDLSGRAPSGLYRP